MATPHRQQRLIGLGLLLALIVLIVFFFSLPRAVAPQTGQTDPVVIDQVAQLPTVDSPLPTVVVIGTIWPTTTPIPTWTPLPTPTRRPGPTATALPIPIVASDSSGIIQYQTRTNLAAVPDSLFLRINATGAPEGKQELLPVPQGLNFDPLGVFPSSKQEYIVYLQAVEPGGRPYLYNKNTGKISVLFDSYSGGNFYGWHPDGERFLFWIDEVGLFLVDAFTLEITTLDYPKGPVQGAAISPDGLTVVFIANAPQDIAAPPPTGEDRLWFVSTAGSDAKVSLPGSAIYLYPGAWSPDSTKLIYYGVCSTVIGPKGEIEQSGLCILDRTTGDSEPIKLPYSGFAPVWSPDGRYIATTGITSGQKDCMTWTDDDLDRIACQYNGHSIYLVDTQTMQVSEVGPGIAPIWSPDGSAIAFLSNQTGNPEIWSLTLTNQIAQPVAKLGNFYIEPGSLNWIAEAK